MIPVLAPFSGSPFETSAAFFALAARVGSHHTRRNTFFHVLDPTPQTKCARFDYSQSRMDSPPAESRAAPPTARTPAPAPASSRLTMFCRAAWRPAATSATP